MNVKYDLIKAALEKARLSQKCPLSLFTCPVPGVRFYRSPGFVVCGFSRSTGVIAACSPVNYIVRILEYPIRTGDGVDLAKMSMGFVNSRESIVNDACDCAGPKSKGLNGPRESERSFAKAYFIVPGRVRRLSRVNMDPWYAVV
ncbi:uncharacterized protein LOC120849276 [Ixodes scapularis]|uniref:uncharacterized protein LOC120849276 n=1 Tax=Ixodes scapularis TaxID=6945 RepID=UPI001C392C84|nr:uncharacterized protein LOC120849276 [Ixodes scapularis]